jgi:hypothetical protein
MWNRHQLAPSCLLASIVVLAGCSAATPQADDSRKSVATAADSRELKVGSAAITLYPHSEAQVQNTDLGPRGNLFRGTAYIRLKSTRGATLSLGMLNTMVRATEGEFVIAIDERALLTTVNVCSGAAEILANNPGRKAAQAVADGYVSIPAGQRAIVNKRGEVSAEELSADDCQ